MKSIDHVGITFANLVLGRGINNGVVNVTLGVLEFEPVDDAKSIDPSPAVVARLRLDIPCTRLLHETLGALLEVIDHPDKPGNGALVHDNSATEGKPN